MPSWDGKPGFILMAAFSQEREDELRAMARKIRMK